MENADNLKFLIRAKYGSIKKFAEAIEVSENTVNNHLKDGNWDRNQMIRVIRALQIPKSMVYLYFFEDELAKTRTEAT
jgi:transcriptional antiterminator